MATDAELAAVGQEIDALVLASTPNDHQTLRLLRELKNTMQSLDFEADATFPADPAAAPMLVQVCKLVYEISRDYKVVALFGQANVLGGVLRDKSLLGDRCLAIPMHEGFNSLDGSVDERFIDSITHDSSSILFVVSLSEAQVAVDMLRKIELCNYYGQVNDVLFIAGKHADSAIGTLPDDISGKVKHVATIRPTDATLEFKWEGAEPLPIFKNIPDEDKDEEDEEDEDEEDEEDDDDDYERKAKAYKKKWKEDNEDNSPMSDYERKENALNKAFTKKWDEYITAVGNCVTPELLKSAKAIVPSGAVGYRTGVEIVESKENKIAKVVILGHGRAANGDSTEIPRYGDPPPILNLPLRLIHGMDGTENEKIRIVEMLGVYGYLTVEFVSNVVRAMGTFFAANGRCTGHRVRVSKRGDEVWSKPVWASTCSRFAYLDRYVLYHDRKNKLPDKHVFMSDNRNDMLIELISKHDPVTLTRDHLNESLLTYFANPEYSSETPLGERKPLEFMPFSELLGKINDDTGHYYATDVQLTCCAGIDPSHPQVIPVIAMTTPGLMDILIETLARCVVKGTIDAYPIVASLTTLRSHYYDALKVLDDVKTHELYKEIIESSGSEMPDPVKHAMFLIAVAEVNGEKLGMNIFEEAPVQSGGRITQESRPLKGRAADIDMGMLNVVVKLIEIDGTKFSRKHDVDTVGYAVAQAVDTMIGCGWLVRNDTKSADVLPSKMTLSDPSPGSAATAAGGRPPTSRRTLATAAAVLAVAVTVLGM